MSRRLYSLGWWVSTPLVLAYLLWRSWRQPEYRAHWAERWSLRAPKREPGPLVWVHAVSVGETRAAQPLVDALLERDPALRILLTHMTPTGREAGAQSLVRRHGARVVQAYLPYDYGFAMRRFLRGWHPALGIVIETELWPNLCAAAAAQAVPIALVNARLSPRSLRKGLRWRSLIEPALRSLCRVVAQTDADATRIRALGRDDVEVAGNVKFDIEAPAQSLATGRRWRARFGGQPVVLAASTRDGEEALLVDAWRAGAAADAGHGAATPATNRPAHRTGAGLLAIVPRHPQRFDAVAALIAQRGLRVVRRSTIVERESVPAQGPVEPRDGEAALDADVLLGDSMGEMFAYYGLADVAIIGGSLLPFGGQNLIEACAAGVPVVLGEHTYNFAEAAEQAIAAGAGIRVGDAVSAVETARALLSDSSRRSEMARCAASFAAAHRGATRRTIALLAPWLPDGR